MDWGAAFASFGIVVDILPEQSRAALTTYLPLRVYKVKRSESGLDIHGPEMRNCKFAEIVKPR